MLQSQEIRQFNDGEIPDIDPSPCPGCGKCRPLSEEDAVDEPSNVWYDLAAEPSFSWSPCDGCGSRLGGNRYPAHTLDEDSQIIHLEICEDCLVFFANGDDTEHSECAESAR